MCVDVRPQGAAAYPENEDQQQRLREAAEGLRVATNAAAQNAIKKKLVSRLEVSQTCQHVCISLFACLPHYMLRPCNRNIPGSKRRKLKKPQPHIYSQEYILRF